MMMKIICRAFMTTEESITLKQKNPDMEAMDKMWVKNKDMVVKK